MASLRMSEGGAVSDAIKVALADGGHLNARFHAGPSGAPTLVLSNSVMTDLGVWDSQIADLTRVVSVLRYDQRGHGQSSITSGPMTFDDYGSDVLALMDAFDESRCIFLGLSMGVPTGLAAFGQASDRFQAFVAVDGVAKSAPGREAFWSERRDTARDKGMAHIAPGTAQRWLPGETATSQVVEKLSAMVAATPVEGFAAATFALQDYDYTDVVTDMALPFLAITGAEDGAMPDAMQRQFGGIQGARFELIESAGHVPNFQRPELFNNALLPFLRSLT